MDLNSWLKLRGAAMWWCVGSVRYWSKNGLMTMVQQREFLLINVRYVSALLVLA